MIHSLLKDSQGRWHQSPPSVGLVSLAVWKLFLLSKVFSIFQSFIIIFICWLVCSMGIFIYTVQVSASLEPESSRTSFLLQKLQKKGRQTVHIHLAPYGNQHS